MAIEWMPSWASTQTDLGIGFFGARSFPPYCPYGSYTAPNGLEFDTYCAQIIGGGDLHGTQMNSMTDCVDICSESGGCFGATYYPGNGSCYLQFNSIAVLSVVGSDSDGNSAIANSTQFTPFDTICPYQNTSTIKSSDGLAFEILCDVEMYGYGDYYPEGQHYNSDTSTMMDCMDLCSEAHPLCLGVSWNPDLIDGYGNCYLKNSQNGTPQATQGYIMHSALAHLPSIDACSNSEPSQVSSNGEVFNVTCFEGRTGSSNITSFYSMNVTGCIDACANYTGVDTCHGVTFDNSMQYGFENCYLLNETGSAYPGLNATYAEWVAFTSYNGSPDVPAPVLSSNSSSKAWIAGPVIGGVVALALVVLGTFWWRRRVGQKETQSDSVDARPEMKSSPYELPAESRVPELEGSSPRYEMPIE